MMSEYPPTEIEEIQITLYFVGDDPQQAAAGLTFDEWRDAEIYRADNGYAHVYMADTTVFVVDFEVSE